MYESYVVDVFAIELSDKLLKTVAVSLNANGFEDGLDVM
jgi:hypothetical protein